VYGYGGMNPYGELSPFFSIYTLIVFAGLYVYNAFALMTIANRTYTENAWMAWIPVLNIYLMVKIAEKPWWWLIIIFIPILGIIPYILVWMRISERLGKSPWLGVLMIVPVVSLVVIGYLAWG